MTSLLCCSKPNFWMSRHKKDQTKVGSRTKPVNSVPIYITSSKPISTNPKSVGNDTPLDISDISSATTLTPKSVRETEQQTQTQSALVVIEKGKYALLESYPIPSFENDNEVLIRTYAVGLNPIDWKSVEYNFCLPTFPWVTGREMAGVVQRVAPGVQRLKIGDRVWTSTYYRDIRAGCFQEYVTVPQHTVSPIPHNLTFESAACLGVAALTAGMTLWKWLGVSMPTEKGVVLAPAKDAGQEYLLVWGGSTVTGQFAIQIAVLCGLKVVAVTSAKTQRLAQGLGAQVITRDSKSAEEIVAEILNITGDNITKAIDLVGSKNTAISLLAVSKSRPVDFAPLAQMGTHSVAGNITIHTVEMKRFVLDEESVIYSNKINQILDLGLVRMPEINVMDGGLSVIEEGLDLLKRGDMSGRKLVVSIMKK